MATLTAPGCGNVSSVMRPSVNGLNRLCTPESAKKIIRQLQAADSPYKVLVSPLLLETSQHRMVDRILIVDVPETIQIDRTTSRDNVPESQVQAIINAQASRQEKLDKADDIIDNSSDLTALRQQVESLHEKYLKLSKP